MIDMAVGKDTHVLQNDPESAETAAARRLTDALAPPVVGLRGDLHAVFGQHGADRLDPETVPVGVDVAEFT